MPGDLLWVGIVNEPIGVADTLLQTLCNEVTTVENKKIATVAKKLGVTTQAVYKKLAKLGDQVATELIKEGGATKLTPRGLEILEEAFGKNQPTSPTEVTTVGNLVETLQKNIDEKQSLIINQQDMIRQLLEKQAEERQRTDSIIMKLAHDLEGTRKAALAIEAKVDALTEKKDTNVPVEILAKPPEPVHVWQPTPRKADPTRDLPWYQRAWIKFAHPERCRRDH